MSISLPDLFEAGNVTSSVNQHRASTPQQSQFLGSANISAALGTPRPVSASSFDWMGSQGWYGVAGGSENCLSLKNGEELMCVLFLYIL